MTLHILSVNNEQLSVVLQALHTSTNPIAKEVAIRFKNMATPVSIGNENSKADVPVDESKLYDDYFSCDLEISIVQIKADSEEEAEARMQKFIDKIAPVMDEVIRWDEANWEIQKNVFVKELQEWQTV
jgi:hypothetical protein